MRKIIAMCLYIILIIIVLLFICLQIISNCNVFKIKIRPIKLIFIDKLNNESIKNIKIYYKIGTGYWDNILGIPIIDPAHSRVKIFKEFKSNDSGIIEIKDISIKNTLYENLTGEFIYINLEEKEKIDSKNKNEKLIELFSEPETKRLNKKIKLNNSFYKGVKLVNTYKFDVNENSDEKASNLQFYNIWNSYSLKKEKEEIVIELERLEK